MTDRPSPPPDGPSRVDHFFTSEGTRFSRIEFSTGYRIFVSFLNPDIPKWGEMTAANITEEGSVPHD